MVKHTRKNCKGTIMSSESTTKNGEQYTDYWCTLCKYEEKVPKEPLIEELKEE